MHAVFDGTVDESKVILLTSFALHVGQNCCLTNFE